MMLKSRLIAIVVGMASTITAIAHSPTVTRWSEYFRSSEFGVSMGREGELLFEISVTRRPVSWDGSCPYEIAGTFARTDSLKAMRLYAAEDEDGDGWIHRDEWQVVAEGDISIDKEAQLTKSTIDGVSISVFDNKAYYLALIHHDARESFSERLNPTGIESEQIEAPIDIHEGWYFDRETRTWKKD